MSNFLSDYNKLSRNGDIKYRVDIKNKRVYVPKKYIGKYINIKPSGDIIEAKNGVKVNAQGFASVARLSQAVIEDMAKVINK